ncbi:MAG: hypothetical protein GY850_00795 [bacterium]|nr:hypothetical protein [bacterium]
MNRHNAAAISRSTHCVICGSSLSFHQQWAGDICDDWRCRWARLDREMEAHRQEAAGALGEREPELYRALVVPHRPGSIDVLPAKRRADHLEFLIELVMKVTQGEACDEESGIESWESGTGFPVAIAAAVCAVCGGACCHRAGDQAFLDRAAINRYLVSKYEPESSNVVSTYAAHLPERSFTGSCVYHTIDGCALPRSLRADICNNYRCSGLKQAERWACDDGTTRVYVVVREDNKIKRSAFVQPGSIRHYSATDDLPGAERFVNELKFEMN